MSPPCLSAGHLTFGSLVTQYKITGPVLDAWAEILNRAEGTRLLLANSALKSPCNWEYVEDQFAERSVDRQRLVLCGPADHFAFLEYYDRIDVALDASPYNGGTTTMEALRQGAPVLTSDGDRWASRTSQSAIRDTHLRDFVADGVRSYVDRAVELAVSRHTPDLLHQLRMEMRQKLQRSSACDGQALAGSMEQLYRSVWRGRENPDDDARSGNATEACIRKESSEEAREQDH